MACLAIWYNQTESSAGATVSKYALMLTSHAEDNEGNSRALVDLKANCYGFRGSLVTIIILHLIIPSRCFIEIWVGVIGLQSVSSDGLTFIGKKGIYIAWKNTTLLSMCPPHFSSLWVSSAGHHHRGLDPAGKILFGLSITWRTCFFLPVHHSFTQLFLFPEK